MLPDIPQLPEHHETSAREARHGQHDHFIAFHKMDQARRHVAAFERIVAKQKVIVARMEELGDENGAQIARDFLDNCRQSLNLAIDHLNRLLQRK